MDEFVSALLNPGRRHLRFLGSTQDIRRKILAYYPALCFPEADKVQDMSTEITRLRIRHCFSFAS